MVITILISCQVAGSCYIVNASSWLGPLHLVQVSDLIWWLDLEDFPLEPELVPFKDWYEIGDICIEQIDIFSRCMGR